jgi:ribosomal protein L37AE/L43A
MLLYTVIKRHSNAVFCNLCVTTSYHCARIFIWYCTLCLIVRRGNYVKVNYEILNMYYGFRLYIYVVGHAVA